MSHPKVLRHWPRLATMGLALTIVATAGCSSPKIEGKIGLVDPARLLHDSNAGKKAKESLSAFGMRLDRCPHQRLRKSTSRGMTFLGASSISQ